jgi:hypothetical protein
MTFVWISFASLTKMAPSMIEIRTVWFENVVYSWPSAKKFVYSGWSTICKVMSCTKSVMLSVMLGLPACRKAWSDGPRQVTFLVMSRGEPRPVRLSAPPKPVRFHLRIDSVQFNGRSKNLTGMPSKHLRRHIRSIGPTHLSTI